ncbi:MAG: RNA polymerase sigma factor (TIGR02999 family) [Planctomycetota bacterium]
MSAFNELSDSDWPEKLSPAPLTMHLRDMVARKADARASVIPYLVSELKVIARAYLLTNRAGNSLQPSALVNETYLKLLNGDCLTVVNRVHFYAVAAKAMRQILIDHVREKSSRKRGGDHEHETISVSIPAGERAVEAVDLLDLNRALEESSSIDERQAAVVELRYFGGLEHSEVGQALGISRATAEREWRSARIWLGTRMRPGE